MLFFPILNRFFFKLRKTKIRSDKLKLSDQIDNDMRIDIVQRESCLIRQKWHKK